MLEVQSNGALNLIVDSGRFDAMTLGVSIGGAMDPMALRLGNLLVGNGDDAAGIEVSVFPFRLRLASEQLVAISGDCAATLDTRPIPPYSRFTASADQLLTLQPGRLGARAYVTVAGGLDVPLVLGSRSTDLKAAMGGLEGRALRRGDRLPVGQRAPGAPAASEVGPLGVTLAALRDLFAELEADRLTLRCVIAAEYEAFTAEARHRLEHTDYEILPDSNRQGYRLAGEGLHLGSPLELLSHALIPGTVQVPSSGQPIIQLADANTCGGYPKIATVIETDLWKLGQARPGRKLRFERVTLREALRLSADRSAVFRQAGLDIRLASAIRAWMPTPPSEGNQRQIRRKSEGMALNDERPR